MNNTQYNDYAIRKIAKLLNEKRKEYYIDLHIHSNYSADGTQKVIEIIERAKKLGLDIISITDHDSIKAYDYIFKNYKRWEDNLIVIPGIEFSVTHDLYKHRYHVLKYFFDQSNPEFLKNLEKNKKAYIERVEKQFELIRYNQALNYFIEYKGLKLSMEAYNNFLNRNDNKIPEYTTLMKYINEELIKQDISIWDIYWKLVEYNKVDQCSCRKELVSQKLETFYNKNKELEINHNYRKLSRILAMVGVDDSDYPDYKPSGSLTVNQYNQVNISELNNCGINILAHPDEAQRNTYTYYAPIFCGMELNYRSTNEENEKTRKLVSDKKMVMTFGSDSHHITDKFYLDKSFYRVDEGIIRNILNAVRCAINI